MAITFHRECEIQELTWNNGGDWTTSTAWHTPWKDYSDNIYEPISKGIRLYKINGTGDAQKTQIDLTLHAEKYSQPLGQNPFVRLYVLRDYYPSQPKNIPAYAVATKDVAIDENTRDYNITIDGFNVTDLGIIYVAIVYSGDNILSILFNKKVDVTVEADETPPTCSMWKPTSGSNKYNYNNIEIAFDVTPPTGIHMSEAQLQCSYDNNDWTNPVVSYARNTYTVPANTFYGGTIYCRCRAKTVYSEWGEWAYDSFTALEIPASAYYLSPDGIYQDRTKPIVLKWRYLNDDVYLITHKGAKIEYKYGDSDWQELATVQGNTASYEVSANTFPALAYSNPASRVGGIRWRVSGKNGNDLWSDPTEASFATVDAIPICTPTSPINGTSRDETGKITFLWRVGNSLGTTPKGGHAQYRIGNGSWIDLFDEPYIEEWAGTDPTKQDYGYEADENTFPGAVIYWRVCVYNQDGVAGYWTPEAYFTTVDKPQVSTALTPNNTVEDADEPILFTWSTYSQSGEASRGFELEYSIDGSTWILFAQEGEAFEQETPGGLTPADTYGASESSEIIVAQDPLDEHSYLAPGNTFSPGVIFWHVRSYNRNLSPGEWSEAVSFVAKAAPVVQDLQVTAKPFATVIWQSNDQQNYEIFVDGESLGIFFGTERQYPLPDYLKDGVHTIGLRVLGSFDLWSRIAETQVTIENTPTSTLTLRAPTNIDTALEWTGGSGDFFVYRDGLMIAHTNAHSFTDRTALGEHDYQVVERLASGDYNASAVITRTPDVDCLHIAALSGGEWIAIPHRLKNESDPEYSESQEVVYNHLAGIYEPVASIGQYRDDSGKYSAVFLFNEQEEHKRFRALRGKPVILKTADGEVVIGILHAWERKHVLNHYRYAERREMYAAYSFTIQRIGWGDFIDVPN